MNSTNSNHYPFQIGDIVDDRYKIISEPIHGGMSLVYKAQDLISESFFAIKTPKSIGLEQDELLPFDRELSSLERLEHFNIIKLEHSGKVNGTPFLVLEWLTKNLASVIKDSKPMTWKYFYETYGRVILDALKCAHTQRIAHRDLKPQNIMLDDDDYPKIVDFGIACSINRVKVGNTLKFSASPPYTPPEIDEGFQTESRDVYSWAAIAISCLTGKLYFDIASLKKGLESLREGEVPKSVLSQALSSDPSLRQATASVLIADTDGFHLKALDDEQQDTTLHLSLSSSSLQIAKTLFPDHTEEDIKKMISEDLSKECGALLNDGAFPIELELVGTTIRIICTLDRQQQDRFTITRFFSENPIQAHLRRQHWPILKKIKVEFTIPPFDNITNRKIRAMFSFLRMREEAIKRDADQSAKYQIFETWNSFLSEKERFYKSKQTKIRASEIKIEGERCIASITSDFNIDELGSSLVIQLSSGKPLIFAVEDVVADQIFLKLISGQIHLIPRSNVLLESNFEADRQAIIRQRNAIEDVRRQRAVNPKLLNIICEPNSSSAPEIAGLDPKSINISDDKLQILDAALGVQSIYAVKGPPGTGKTTLITELITNYLKRYPNRRVLLTSQTHVALDHVIVKLEKMGLKDEIVRVASNSTTSAQKIEPSVREFTIERKARKWAEMAEKRAQKFITEYAEKSGIKADELKAAILGESYIKALHKLGELENVLEEISMEEKQIDLEREQQLKVGEEPNKERVLLKTTTLLDRKSKFEEEKDAVDRRVSRLKLDLTKIGEFGNVFLESSVSQSHEWIAALDDHSEDSERFKKIISLQLEWLERLSDVRCLHQAILSESRVAAGTCIGLASIPAIYGEEYDLCIIDEASKATAPETLVPMTRSRTWVLVGDPNQLPPFFDDRMFDTQDDYLDPKYKETMLSIMLESLPTENHGQLTQQHRMVSGIGNLIGTVFYNSSLENIRKDSERKKLIVKAYPNPVTWISTSKKNFKESARGTGFNNINEVHVVISELKKLAKENISNREVITVAVLAAYIAQVRALKEAVDQIEAQLGQIKVEVNTIDAFQGRDADICIYSLTRSNDYQNIGFQREKRRLNVALSRARDALVIIGDDKFCLSITKNNPFLDVLKYINENPDFCSMETL